MFKQLTLSIFSDELAIVPSADCYRSVFEDVTPTETVHSYHLPETEGYLLTLLLSSDCSKSVKTSDRALDSLG